MSLVLAQLKWFLAGEDMQVLIRSKRVGEDDLVGTRYIISAADDYGFTKFLIGSRIRTRHSRVREG